jgi:DNA-binding GntR family transcriptional regulator
MIAEAWDRMWIVRRASSLFVLVPGQAARAQAEHERLVEAVEAGDAKAAAKAMERHRASSLRAWSRVA